MMYLHVLLLVCCVGLIQGEDGCQYQHSSTYPYTFYTCIDENPIDIPKRTLSLNLYFTNTSIPNVTFSNDSERLQGAENVESLQISCKDNNQTTLHVKTGGFSNFNKLNILHLECTNIILDEDAFDGLTNLTFLTIYNGIPINIPTITWMLEMYFTNTSVPNVTFSNDSERLQGAENVEILRISCKDNNQTTLHVKSGGFSNFHKLIFLHLECANIILDEDAFDGLTNLAFLTIYNGIPINIPTRTWKLEMYFTNTSVPNVTFSNDSERLQGAENVDSLRISCKDNNQTTLHVKSGGFSNFDKLIFLHLECANIILDEDAFDGLIGLGRLNIYNGHPINIPTRTCTGSLNLYFTNTAVPNVTFSNDSGSLQGAENVKRLRIICKDNNQTTLHVKSGGFSNLHKLEELHLECTNIVLDEDAFHGLTELRRLVIDKLVNLSMDKLVLNLNSKTPLNLNEVSLYATGHECHYIGFLRRLNCTNEIPSIIFTRTRDLTLNFNTLVPNATFSNDSERLQGADNVTSLEIICKYNYQSTIHVKSGGLSVFKNIQTLNLSDCENIVLDEDAFDGLINLKKLYIYGSVNLSNNELLSNLNPEHLPNIRYLSLRNTGINNNDGFDMDILSRRTWKKALKVDVIKMNISNLFIDSSFKYHIKKSFINPLEFVMNYQLNNSLSVPFIVGIGWSVHITTMRLLCLYSTRELEINISFTSASILNIENACDANYGTLMITQLKLRNGFQFNPGKVFNVSELSITNCLLQNGSNPLFTGSVSLTTLHLSGNNISFIHPDTFKMTPSLNKLDLSTNNLQNMNLNNPNLFIRLFAPMDKLQILHLQGNNLIYLPAKLFINNTLLRSIDLSHNSIKRLTFLSEGLHQLRYINLQNNSLDHIDSSMVDRLKLLCLKQDLESNKSASGIVLKENILACSYCIDNDLISWIQNNSDCISNDSSIKCSDENGRLSNIFTKSPLHCPNKKADKVGEYEDEGDKYIADSDKHGAEGNHPIVYISIAVAFIFLVAAIATCIIKRRTMINANFRFPILGLPMNDLNRPPCKYCVFLAYSSQDEEFVNSKVKPELIDGLKARIKDDIEPLCIGDLNFRIGYDLSDEIITCVEQSKVVLILLTNHYCRSVYCVTEFQRAIQLHKPVIVMVKDKVDQNLMTPEIKMHYKTNTRIIWKWENGDYVLNRSWKDICDSLVNLDRRA